MRNLKNDNRKRTDNVRTMRSSEPAESATFKRDIQLLEKLIVKKLEEKPVSSGNLLATLFNDHFALIERLTETWQRLAVSRMIRSVRLRMARESRDQNQYPLPGFEDMGERVRIGGHEKRFAALTYKWAILHLEELEANSKMNTARITRMKQLLSLMEKYVRQEPEITVREVCEREQA